MSDNDLAAGNHIPAGGFAGDDFAGHELAGHELAGHNRQEEKKDASIFDFRESSHRPRFSDKDGSTQL